MTKAFGSPLLLAGWVLLVSGGVHGAATERSHTDSVLNPGGASSATPNPLALPSFTESEAGIKLDGRLEEAVWSEVPAYDHMTVTSPDRMVPASLRTQTLVFYTRRGLYVGAWNEQAPESRVRRLMSRDGFGNSDAYQIIVDSSGKGLYAYWFMVKLGGSLADGTVLPERRFQNNWDGPWRGEARETPDGWTVEMFLPWSMFNMPDDPGDRRQLAILVTRDVSELHERWTWPALPDTRPKFLSSFQPVTVEGVAPRQEVSLYPFATFARDIGRGEHDWKSGMDVFWRPSPAFFLSAALNPDFGQVEADNAVVNLSAFETFFPEKRLFFVENHDVFDTRSNTWGPHNGLLHTRRIGSSVGSRRGAPDTAGRAFAAFDLSKPVDLRLATKAVAEIGKSRFAVLAAAEDDTKLHYADGSGSAIAPGRDFGVLRYLHDNTENGGRKAIGWMGTVTDHPKRRAAAQVVDGRYQSTDGAWSAAVEVFHSDVESEAGDSSGFAAAGNIRYAPRQGDVHFLRFEYYDDEVDFNDLGFLGRNDFRNVFYEFWHRRQDYEKIRSTNAWVDVMANVSGEGLLLDGFIAAYQGVTFNSNHSVSANLMYNAAAWDDSNSRGNGDYKLDGSYQVNVGWRSPNDRRLAGNVNAGYRSEPLGGSQRFTNAFVVYSPVDRLTARIGVGYTERDSWLLWQGGRNLTSFASRQWSPRLGLGVFFSSRQHLQADLQWIGLKAREHERFTISEGDVLENAARDAGTPPSAFAFSNIVLQLRYRWQIAPLSDLFVVYNRGGGLPGAATGDSFTSLFKDALEEPQQEVLVVKLRYRFGISRER